MFSITSVPFLKIREVQNGFEKGDFVLRSVLLMNGRSRRIGSTIIFTDEYVANNSEEGEVVKNLMTHCGPYGMRCGAGNSYHVVLRDPLPKGNELMEKVFARAADIRKMWSFISCSENFKSVESISTGEKAEFYKMQAENFRKTADEIMATLKSEGIATDDVIYTPAYMYIFPVIKMDESYYKIARDYQVNWVTPNVCVAEDENLFKTYCQVCKKAS